MSYAVEFRKSPGRDDYVVATARIDGRLHSFGVRATGNEDDDKAYAEDGLRWSISQLTGAEE